MDIKERVRGQLERAYELRLSRQLPGWDKPAHVGIVMDGNRRFARDAGLGTVARGHRAGADKLEEVLDWCEEADIAVVSVWGFSVDNFARSAEEVGGLMALFEEKFLDLVTNKRIHRHRIRVRSLGRTELLPKRVQAAIAAAEAATASYSRRTLNIGIAYGGREEIIDAVKGVMAAAAAAGETLEGLAARLRPEDLRPHLQTAPAPDPDLLIRTSGEVRLSGFLLWQSAHSEYYFCDTNWPAFRKLDFLRALRSYHRRQRRFGR